MVSWSWSWSKFDWIEELTQIDWLKIVQINHNAFSRFACSMFESVQTSHFVIWHSAKVVKKFLLYSLHSLCLIDHNI